MTQDNPVEPARCAERLSGQRPPGSHPAISGRYLWVMLSLLMSVTIFEGYDVTIFHLCTPDIARTFHMNDLDVGAMASFVRLGGIAAFFILLAADRVGRKPIVSYTVFFYTLFTLLTALSRGLTTFTVFQSLAQLFLSAEFSVATIMISEEFPDHWRGRGVALLNMIGLVGVIVGGGLYGPIAESAWGWRGMYFIGIAPLLLVAFLRRNLRETVRFSAMIADHPPEPGFIHGMRQSFGRTFGALRGPYRGRLLLIALLWNCVGLVRAPAVTFFALYAKRDRHWTSSEVGHAVVLAYVIGTLGHLLAGYMLDRVGRKATTCLFYVIGALSVVLLFRSTAHAPMLTWMVATVFAFQGARTTTATYSTELFPTAIRATSYSLTVQVLGSIADLLTPFTIGALAQSLGGLGNAVSAVAIGPVIGALLVVLFAPETRGMSLEDLAAPTAPAAD
ncbi:MAG: MFS transporter [Candidatus Binataceae bacterium]